MWVIERFVKRFFVGLGKEIKKEECENLFVRIKTDILGLITSK